jgi:hypothetical protein
MDYPVVRHHRCMGAESNSTSGPYRLSADTLLVEFMESGWLEMRTPPCAPRSCIPFANDPRRRSSRVRAETLVVDAPMGSVDLIGDSWTRPASKGLTRHDDRRANAVCHSGAHRAARPEVLLRRGGRHPTPGKSTDEQHAARNIYLVQHWSYWSRAISAFSTVVRPLATSCGEDNQWSRSSRPQRRSVGHRELPPHPFRTKFLSSICRSLHDPAANSAVQLGIVMNRGPCDAYGDAPSCGRQLAAPTAVRLAAVGSVHAAVQQTSYFCKK